MQKDTKNKFISTILKLDDITNKSILEIGCGTGRITEELAKYAKLVVATDPNKQSIEIAKRNVLQPNVNYVVCKGEELPITHPPFDLVIYTLSLHHIPEQYMIQSLERATNTLNDSGKIIIIEPGYSGSFIEMEETFNLGCGIERYAKEITHRTITSFLRGTSTGVSANRLKLDVEASFHTDFYFKNLEDFYKMFVGRGWKGDNTRLDSFLDAHTENEGIRLVADRTAYLLSKN